jgi:hypothetical protein
MLPIVRSELTATSLLSLTIQSTTISTSPGSWITISICESDDSFVQ